MLISFAAFQSGQNFEDLLALFVIGLIGIFVILSYQFRSFVEPFTVMVAIPLALITGGPYPASIAVIGVLTVIYTYFGGIKAVVWVDAVQLGEAAAPPDHVGDPSPAPRARGRGPNHGSGPRRRARSPGGRGPRSSRCSPRGCRRSPGRRAQRQVVSSFVSS